MNEQNLHVLLSRILLATTSLALGGVACGGTAEDSADNETMPSGGASSGGASSGGSGGVVGTGGILGAGGSATGGTGGVIGTGGVVGSGGAATGGSGGVGTGGAGGSCAAPATAPPCGGHAVTVDRACLTLPTPTQAECMQVCGQGGNFVPFTNCYAADNGGDQVTVQCGLTCAVGRRPAGLVPCEERANDLGDYFARAAYLEAASVRAFRDLRAELHARNAPRSLLRALSRAARDEVRHARATTALARRFGARPEKPVTTPVAPRSLEQLAIENVTEGCVRETYGALLAHFQATAAQDGLVRAELRRIARDETRHASLSWRVQRWLEARLDRAALERVQAARRAAAVELRVELAAAPPRELVDQAGVPAAEQALRLVDGLASALWSNAA